MPSWNAVDVLNGRDVLCSQAPFSQARIGDCSHVQKAIEERAKSRTVIRHKQRPQTSHRTYWV